MWLALLIVASSILSALKLGSLPGLPVHKIHELDIDSIGRLVEEPLALKGNQELRQAKKLFQGVIQGSETVAVEQDGSLLLLDKYNYAWRAVKDEAAPGGFRLSESAFAYLGTGRPLGFKVDAYGNVLVCNSNQGLIKLTQQGSVELLSARVSDDSPLDPGTLITYANDLDISNDGTVYFTDSHDIPVTKNWEASTRPWFDTFTSFLYGLYSGSRTGRLLAYYPHNQTTHVLAKNLWYANGVALSVDSSFVAVAETNQFRIMRYWLKGPQAGSLDTLVDRLPGFPDGVSAASDGGFWVALPGRRTGLLKAMRIKFVRSLLPWFPASLKPRVTPWGAVIKVSSDGHVNQILEDPTGEHIAFVSAVEEHADHGRLRLFLGNIVQDYISYIDIT